MTNTSIFFLSKNQQKFSDKHVLLIDDVVTTGSTLESCAFQILKIENVKVEYPFYILH